jgi:uncharacterized membrane protein YfhO
VFVSSQDAAHLGAVGNADSDAGFRSVTFRYEDKKRVTIKVSEGTPGYLVLADTFFAGWEATIGGESVEIARGNLYQRVVTLPATACTVEFRFRAEGFVSGVAIGGVGGLGFITLLIAGVWRRRREPQVAAEPDAA